MQSYFNNDAFSPWEQVIFINLLTILFSFPYDPGLNFTVLSRNPEQII